MKLDTKILRAALSDLSSVIKTRTTLPAYECVNFVAEASGVKLQATDGQAWMSRAMAAENPVAFMVSFSLLNQLIARVESEFIEFNVEGAFITLEMGCTRKLRCFTGAEFPAIPKQKIDSLVGIGCNVPDLGDSIAAVAWAVSRDTNADMHKRCVLVDLSALEMACAATRGTSMAVQQLKSICEQRQFYILGEYAQVFADVCREPESEASTNDSMVAVESSLTTLYVLQPHASVWDWRKYAKIAREASPTSIPRSVLMRNCHDAIVMGGMDKKIVPRISIRSVAGGKVEVVTTGTDGNSGVQFIDASKESTDLDINVPPQQLLEFCQNVAGEAIICRSKPNAAFFECGDLTAILAQCPRTNNA